MSSILGMSQILVFYGGRAQIKSLLYQLAQGGKDFYECKVKYGKFFRDTVVDSCHLELSDAERKFEDYVSLLRSAENFPKKFSNLSVSINLYFKGNNLDKSQNILNLLRLNYLRYNCQ
jgi:hypothetical protein